MMKLIISIVLFFLPFTMCAHAQQKSFDAQALKKEIANEINSFKNELRFAHVDGFLNGLVNEFSRYEDASLIMNKYKRFFPDFVRRIIYFNGEYINETLGQYIATSFIFNVKRREVSGTPILSKQQAKKKIDIINSYEHKVVSFVQRLGIDDIKGLDAESKSHLNWENEKGKILERIRFICGVHRRSLIDPSFTMAPTEISQAKADAVVMKFKKMTSDILDLSQSGKSLDEKYPGILHLSGTFSSDAKLVPPPFIILRYRLAQIADLLPVLETFNAHHYIKNVENGNSNELKSYYERYEELLERKDRFENSYFGDDVPNFESITLKNKVMKIFSED